MVKKVLTYLIFIGIAVLFSWLAYNVITEEKTIQEIWHDLKEANYYWVFLSMIMGYMAIMSRGIRWKILLEPLGYKPKTWNSIHSVAIAYLSNLAVPRSGEIARCTSLYSTDHIPVDKLIGTVISERVVDFIVLFFFMFLAIVLNLNAFDIFLEQFELDKLAEKTSLLISLGIGFIILVAIIYIFRKKIGQLAFFQKVGNFLKGIKEGVFTVLKMKKKLQFIGHTVFIWSMYAGMAIVVFQSLEATKHIPISQGLFIMVAGGIGMVLPSPGGTGTYVWAVSIAFIALGLSKTDGGEYGFLVWIAQTLMMIIGGFIGLFMIMRAKSKSQKMNKEVL